MALDATAAKVKKKSGRASHLYHQKAFITNATKAKKESANASHLYHRKAFITNAAKVKKESAKLLISLTKGHKMKKIAILSLVATILLGGAAGANKINRVIPVDFITIEVVMDEPLSADETDPFGWEKANRFDFGGLIQMTGAPMEVEMKGYPNTYHIPVAGMDIGVIYRISYDGGKAKTFRVYEEQEMTEKYKNRYGDYF